MNAKTNGAQRFCIVVSGLPASGKSSLGEALARRLRLPLLDKDTYLEQLFETRGIGDESRRRSLSRESDTLLRQEAAKHRSAVLVSHWRPPGSSADSGTPVEWLGRHFEQVVEVCCACPVPIAARRFLARKRHPGHLDASRRRDEVEAWFEAYAKSLPLSVGALITVASDGEIDLVRLCDRVLRSIDGPESKRRADGG